MADTRWAHRRRFRVTILLLVLVIVFFGLYFGIGLYRPPSCFDGKKNQTEEGVDCGGVCARYCSWQTQEVRLLWSRTFESTPGVYNAVAYLENPNFDKQTDGAKYRFRMFDREGIMVHEKEGVIAIRREPIVGIFESRIFLPSGEPYRTTFEWMEPIVWKKADPARRVQVGEEAFMPARVGSELRAIVKNTEPVILRDVEVLVFLYDSSETVVAVSNTYIDFLAPRENKTISFAWSIPLPKNIGRVEFIPRVPAQ
jgi:hypothetical protein